MDSHLYKTFLEKIQLPSLSEEDSKKLGQPIEESDLRAAIKCMCSGKAPGPDGLPRHI